MHCTFDLTYASRPFAAVPCNTLLKLDAVHQSCGIVDESALWQQHMQISSLATSAFFCMICHDDIMMNAETKLRLRKYDLIVDKFTFLRQPRNWLTSRRDVLVRQGSNNKADMGVHLKRDSIDDVQGVDDIAQRLGHLATMSITHHGMQVHLLEGYFAYITAFKVQFGLHEASLQ